MTDDLKKKLIDLANKYETPSFLKDDPSQFLRWYSEDKGDSLADIECASFIAAMLAFGNRKQFIPKIKYIFELADENSGCIFKWLINDAPGFPFGEEKFYRFYSFNDLRDLFREMVNKGDSPICFSEVIKHKYLQNPELDLADIISDYFISSKIIPKGKNSAKKRVYMYLRWMVRQNSPVDLGIWNWYSQGKLIIPLDVHVLQESKKLGLIEENASPSKKTAVLLSKILNEVFPGDPCKGDYALFGLGISNN